MINLNIRLVPLKGKMCRNNSLKNKNFAPLQWDREQIIECIKILSGEIVYTISNKNS